MAANTSPPPSLLTASNPGFSVQTRKPIVTFNTRDVDPPSIVYVTTIDRIVIDVWAFPAAPQLTFRFRILRADGQIIRQTETYTPLGTLNRERLTFQLPEGFLLSLSISSVGVNSQRGVVWVEASIGTQDGPIFDLYQTLVADYVTFNQSVAWPGGRIISSTEGPGLIGTLQTNSLVAGAPLNFSVQTNNYAVVYAISFQLVTDAVAGNRQVSIFYPTAGSPVVKHTAQTTQPASTTYTYFASAIGFRDTDVVPSAIYIPVPLPLPCDVFRGIQVRATGFDAGDQFTSAFAYANLWIQPQS